jgi:hypothetical protein
MNCGVLVADIYGWVESNRKPPSAAEGALCTNTRAITTITLHAGLAAGTHHTDGVYAGSEHTVPFLGASLDACANRRYGSIASRADHARTIVNDGSLKGRCTFGVDYVEQRIERLGSLSAW